MRPDKIVIGLVGESGSGKDTVAEYLKHVYDATLMRFSDPIKDILKMFFTHPSREDQAWVAVEFKKRFGEDVFCRAVEKKINGNTLISFNGLRYMVDYEFLKKFDHHFLMYVTADQKLRWERTLKRGEKADDNIEFEAFKKTEASLPTERDIPAIGANADFVIRNESTIEDLFIQVDKVMEQILKTKHD